MTFVLLVPAFGHAQTLTTTMAGKWKIDVTASIRASEKTKNERAISGAKTLPDSVQGEFNSDGNFRWGSSGGQWSVKEELKDELQVVFRYPKFERPAKVKVVGKNSLHFHFRPDYPICVYQRVHATED